MALNKQIFRVRAISAVGFVLVMLAGILWSKWSFLMLFSIVHFGCWWEYLKIIEKIQQAHFHTYTKYGFIITGYGLMLAFCNHTFAINGYGIKQNLLLACCVAGFLLLCMGVFLKNNFTLKAFAAAALGWVYLSASWGTMLGLAAAEHPFWKIPLALIVSIWINDTMAYIVGSFIGKTPFSTISPNKTWEGTLGGALLCIVAMCLAAHYFLKLSWNISILLPLIAAVVGTLGDLLESKLKRMAQVKDSGTMMPGHGGFLDRFDSLILATPVAWFVLFIIAKSF